MKFSLRLSILSVKLLTSAVNNLRTFKMRGNDAIFRTFYFPKYQKCFESEKWSNFLNFVFLCLMGHFAASV